MKYRVRLQAQDPHGDDHDMMVSGSMHYMENLPARGDFVRHAEHGIFEVMRVIHDLPSIGEEPWRTPQPCITLIVRWG